MTWTARAPAWASTPSAQTCRRARRRVDDNLSGLAWDADRRQLWAVVNNPEALVALDENGGTIARYPLEGFTDVEGIAYLGDDLLLLAEEREQRLVALPVPTREGPLRRGAGQTLSLSLGEAGNAGFEGLGYDLRATGCSWSRSTRRASSTRSAGSRDC